MKETVVETTPDRCHFCNDVGPLVTVKEWPGLHAHQECIDQGAYDDYQARQADAYLDDRAFVDADAAQFEIDRMP